MSALKTRMGIDIDVGRRLMKVKRSLAVCIRSKEIKHGMAKCIRTCGLSNLRCSHSASDY